MSPVGVRPIAVGSEAAKSATDCLHLKRVTSKSAELVAFLVFPSESEMGFRVTDDVP